MPNNPRKAPKEDEFPASELKEDDFWDAFLPDDEHEVLPEPGDFWIDQEQQTESHTPDA